MSSDHEAAIENGRPVTRRRTAAPQDHKPKATAKAAEIADEEVITEFTYDGFTYVGYGDNLTGEVMEALEVGALHVGVRALLGEDSEGWAHAKKLPVRKLKGLWETWGETAQAGNS
jgi:hypothetical protein